MTLHAIEEVALWMESETPVRLVWRGVRWRVSDIPTQLTETTYETTHPMTGLRGWRFQATNDHGQSRVFDVEFAGPRWLLIGVYD